jgi:multidrug efflux pump
MTGLVRWLVDHATTVAIAALCVFAFGLLSYITLPRESSPDITIPVVIVSTPYIGVSPEDIESLITIPMENELASLKNVKVMRSTSAEGVSIVVIEFEPDTVIEDALQRVRDRVGRVRPTLPDDVEEPSIREISFSDIPVVLITIAGDVSEDTLKELAEDLQDELTRIDGVLDVDLTGGTEREIQVQIIPERLAHYGLAMHDVVGALGDENVNIPGGNVEVGRGNFLLRVPGEFKTTRDIEQVAIKRVGDRPVFVRDVARVVDGYAERETYSRMAGQASVTLAVKKRAGANILEVASNAKATAAAQAERWPAGVTFRALGDESKYIAQSVADLQNNILTALILVIAVIVLFMGFRPSLFVAMSIPLSMLASMLVLDVLGFTLNMVVLFSLILALGMLVDNAIVVVENVYRHQEMGKDRRQAAIDGTSEVAVAVAASTATTVAAFFPLVFWTGIMGEFMGFLPKTVIIVLVMSLVMAIAVLPVVMSRFMPQSIGAGRDPEEKELRNAELGFAMSAYRSLLRWSIRWRYLSVALGVGSLLVTFVIYGFLNHGTEFFPATEPDRAIAGIRLPQGTDVDTTDRVTREVERILATQENVDTWVADVGVSASGDALRGSSANPNEARITIDFLPDANTAMPGEKPRIEPSSVTVDRLRALVAEIPGAKITVEPQEMGPPVGKPINLELSGEDFDEVGETALKLRRDLVATVPGLADLEDDYGVGRPELRLRIDRGAAKRVGVSTASVGNAVRTAVAGAVATSVRDGEKEVDVVVELAPEYREDLQKVLDLRLPGREDTSPDTFPVPLSTVATYELAGGSAGISHIDQDMVVTISGDVAEGFNENEVRAAVQAFLDDYELPGGMATALTGANAEQEEAMVFLVRAFFIAVALILLVLVTQFDSLSMPGVILATVILSLIGVLWGLMLTGTPFGIIMTGIGVISLAGVVVNNAIVLLDYVQQLLDRGLSTQDALVEAGLTRFRPVMLTAITTALGLVPMALGTSFDFLRFQLVVGSTSAQWWGPMAVAVIFGLSFATVLTLVMVPTLYTINDDFRGLRERVRGLFRRPTAAAAASAAAAVLLALLPFGAGATTLDEAWAAAEQNDLTLALAREDAVQVGTLRGKAWSALSPRLSANATHVINNQEIAFAFDPSEFLGTGLTGIPGFELEPAEPVVIQERTFWQGDVTVTQRLFSGSALPALRAAYKLNSAGKQDLRAAQQRTRANVARTFYSLMAAQQAVAVSEKGLEIAKAQLTLAERRRDAGLTDRRSLVQAQLGVSQAERDLESARETLVQAETGFQMLTGLEGTDLQLPEPFRIPEDVENALIEARERRPDLVASRYRSQALTLQRTAQDLRWMPVLDASGSYNYTENLGFNDRNWTWRIALSATWELWDGGTRIADRKETASQARAAKIAEALAAQQAEREVRLAYEAHRRAEQALQAVEDELALARESLLLAERSYEAGSATWLELEQARLQLDATNLALLRERTTRDLAAIDLLARTGSL